MAEAIQNPGQQPRISQRIHTLDMARFLAMLMMIQGHVIFALGSPEIINIQEFPWNIWNFLRGFTAPVFLMVSGAAQVFANKRLDDGRLPTKTVRRRFKMAIALVAIGYLMVFPAERIYDLPFIEYKYWQAFFKVNILQLIGVTLMMALGAFMITRSDKQLFRLSLGAGLFIAFATPFVQCADWFAFIPDFAAAYLCYDQGSLFTVFPFSAYLFFGIALGVYLKKMPQGNREGFLLKWGIPIGAALIALSFPVGWIYESAMGEIVSKADPGVTMLRSGAVFVGLALISILYRATKPLTRYYTIFGKRALLIYVIHLIVIYGTPIFPSFNHYYAKSLPLADVLLAALFVEVITLGITYLFEVSNAKLPAARVFYRYSLTAYLIYILFI